MNIIDAYLQWVTERKVPWYEFWDPRSGLIGGFVTLCAIYVVVHFIFACLGVSNALRLPN